MNRKRGSIVRHGIFAVSIVASAFAFSGTARAEGALALGLIKEDLSRGFAAGWGTNYPTAERASSEALTRCQNEQTAPPNIRALCRIIGTFRDQCVSIAIDPEAGETGTGWAIAPTRSDADAQALADCRKTAGQGREQYCRIATGGCDGNAR
ncbi:MAG: DUF4189 domain-containing protein [Xanthobacteraceae bacterium]|nr:DUF4189 domain-containing protein [Xanthobacteraceae bacterium]QYK46314.1 MAG: DUF4189 domain-containing protein [Xanthobacteraceae bacterium]